ncbi:hypothetical protein [Streptomyces sp. NBC_01003]|uniref:hypothetical protein n=1 Tax=Streptomyces sp. NBC_01003 TaxID=2903714 RepID=UPI00386D7461
MGGDLGSQVSRQLAITDSEQVIGIALALPLFEVEYLAVDHAEIYVGQSRHWVVAWLWFLS